LNKSILATIAGMSVVALSVTPAAAAAVTSLPAGDQMVVSEGGAGIFEFLDESWTGTTRFDPVANEMTYAIGITFNPADGLIYGVNGWNDDESDQQVFSVDPATGASEAWDIDYGTGNSSGYETRSIAFDGEGKLVALACLQIEIVLGPDDSEVDCPDIGKQQYLVDLVLTDAGVAEAGDFLELDYNDTQTLASVAWNPISESFFVLSYDLADLSEVASDGSLGTPFDVLPFGLDPDNETTDVAFDSEGVAWICYDYCDRFFSLNLDDGTATNVADGGDVEGMTILRPQAALSDTGVDGSNLGLLAIVAISAMVAGAWFARRRLS
jgi:hypothetical protein